MNNLIELVITGNLAEATELFETHMIEIREKKLYEVKRTLGELYGYGRGKEFTKGPLKGKTDAEKRDMAKQAVKLHKQQKDFTKDRLKQKNKTDPITTAKPVHSLAKGTKLAHKIKSLPFKDRVKLKTAMAMQKIGKKFIDYGNRPIDKNNGYDYGKLAGSEPSHPKHDDSSTEKTNGVIRRNWNTFRGRDAEDKPEPTKKGRLGRFVKGVAGAAGIDTSSSVGGIVNDILGKARGPLEEQTFHFKKRTKPRIIKTIRKTGGVLGPKVKRKPHHKFARIVKDK